MEWIFYGIGTEIITTVIGLIVGGVIGYRIGVKNKNIQCQKAGNNAQLTQIGNIVNNGNTESGR